MGEWLIKEKRAKWHSAMPPSSLRVMYGSYYRADKYYKENGIAHKQNRQGDSQRRFIQEITQKLSHNVGVSFINKKGSATAKPFKQ
jgi:hypothetical protein